MKYSIFPILLILQCVASFAQSLDFSKMLCVDYAFSKAMDVSLRQVILYHLEDL